MLLFIVIWPAGCAHLQKPAVAAAPRTGLLVAVFPLENMTGRPAPMKDTRQFFVAGMEEHGYRLLDEDSLERFMSKHRVRYVGGIEGETAAALKAETGADAVLIGSVELYDETAPPKVAIRARLVSLSQTPEILSMESVGMAGDDAPGLLGIGLVEDPEALLRKAAARLVDSLAAQMRGRKSEEKNSGIPGNTAGADTNTVSFIPEGTSFETFGPKWYYRAPSVVEGKKPRVIVMPFLNKSGRRYAGDVVRLDVTEQLAKHAELRVVEPGVLRQALLQLRIIINDGPSLADISAVSSVLTTDIVVSGNVLAYHDYIGPVGSAKVNFTVQAISAATKELLWSSVSHNKSDDNLLLFDWGRVNTAQSLARKMTEAVAIDLLK